MWAAEAILRITGDAHVPLRVATEMLADSEIEIRSGAVRAAYDTLHNAVAAMDPCLRRHVEWDRYDRFYWVRW